jgi:beta-glucosidase
VPDPLRVAFLESHLDALSRAIEAGVPMRGYFVWSLMDNFEWARGYSQRFGITYINYTTQQRLIKDSGHWYRHVATSNSLPATNRSAA